MKTRILKETFRDGSVLYYPEYKGWLFWKSFIATGYFLKRAEFYTYNGAVEFIRGSVEGGYNDKVSKKEYLKVYNKEGV